MRKVFLDDLPKKKGFGANKDKEIVDWEASIGVNMRFEYDDVNDVLKVVKYNKEKSRVCVEYNNNTVELKTDALRYAKLAKVVGGRKENHIYTNGEIINNLKIIECIKIKRNDRNSLEKGYVVECCKDENVFEIDEYSLKRGRGCPVCAGVKLIVGVNDVYTINKNIKRYLVNSDDAHNYTHGSNKRIDFKCPDCGTIKNMKISNFVNKGFSCMACGDGISYPNKLMYNILLCANVDFETEYSPEWAIDESGRKRRYDFYIPSKNLIIEMDGGLGHGNGVHKKCNITKQQSKDIDNTKDIMALNNNMCVIRIDCNYNKAAERFEYISKNILNSDINKYIDINHVDFYTCSVRCEDNKVKQACEMWNSGEYETTTDIGMVLKLSNDTIRNYLKRGNKFKWCVYDAQEELLKNLKKNSCATKKITIETLSERTIKICELWDSGVKSSSKIGNIVGLSTRNVIRHLKTGASLGVCGYTVEEARNSWRL